MTQKQINGWLKNIPSFMRYYRVIGDTSIKDNYIDEKINIIFVKRKR